MPKLPGATREYLTMLQCKIQELHTVFVQYVPTRNQPRLKISANIQCLKRLVHGLARSQEKTDLLRTHCARPEIIPD